MHTEEQARSSANKRETDQKSKRDEKRVETTHERARALSQLRSSGTPRSATEVLSYRSIIHEVNPDYFFLRIVEPHLDEVVVRMNELRGLILGQSSETERVLIEVLNYLDVSVSHPPMAGKLSRALNSYFAANLPDVMPDERKLIELAVEIRNRVAHEYIEIGSVWRDYATGGGEWMPVISFLGGDEYDESDLIDDLDIQKEATRAAVSIWAVVEDWESEVRQERRDGASQ